MADVLAEVQCVGDREPVVDPEVEKVRVGDIDCDFVNEGEPDVVPVTD